MKPDDIGITKLTKRYRECNLCGKQYNLNTSSNTIYIHACRHKQFHDILRRELGEAKFQEKLNNLPKNFRFEDYVSEDSNKTDTSSQLKSPTEDSSGSSGSVTRKRKLLDHTIVGTPKDLVPSLPVTRNMSTRLSENLASKVNSDTPSKDNYLKDISLDSKRINVDKIKCSVDDAPGISDYLPDGFRKVIKTDVLGLTKLISINHRICLGCNRKFQSSCGVTSLYKHCIRHPEHRAILKKNLATTAYINALKNAHIPYTEDDIKDEHGHLMIAAEESPFFTSNQSLSDLLEKAKSYDCLNKSSSSAIVENNDIVNVLTDGTSTLKNLIMQPIENQILETPVKKPSYSNKEFKNLLHKFLKTSGLSLESLERDGFSQLSSLFRYKNVNQLVKEIIDTNELKNCVDRKILENIENYTISIEEYTNSDNIAAIIKIYYLDIDSRFISQNLGIISFKDDMEVNEFEKIYNRITVMLEKFKLKLTHTTPLVSRGTIFSRRFSVRSGITEIPCLRHEIIKCILHIQSTSSKIFSVLRKASKKFSLYKYVVDNEMEVSSKLKEIKGVKAPTGWVDIYNILAFGALNITEAIVFCQEFWPSFILTNEELEVVYRFITISQPVIEALNLLTSDSMNITSYLKTIVDISSKYDNYEILPIKGDLTKLLQTSNAVSINNSSKLNEYTHLEAFEILCEPVNNDLANENILDLFKSLKSKLCEEFLDLTNKSKENALICKALLLNTEEAYNPKYGDITFWTSIESLFSSSFGNFDNDTSRNRISFDDGNIKSAHLYRNLLYNYDNEYLNEFWPSQKNVLPLMYNEYIRALSIPVKQNRLNKSESLFDWIKSSNYRNDDVSSDMYFTPNDNYCQEVIVID
uniref:C2H2-type domain-containing protein n=1 Tax=Strongyloides venezuelensis TaxID=75913 RepID=A0A0K0FVS0_STRVS